MQLPIRRGQTLCLPRLDESSCMRLIDGLNCRIRVSKDKPARWQCRFPRTEQSRALGGLLDVLHLSIDLTHKLLIQNEN